MHEIVFGAGAYVGMPEPIANPQTRDRYIVNSLIQEAIASSQLEGAVTTREVARDMLRSGRLPRDDSERMILNNYLTMQEIIRIKEKHLSVQLLLDIHRMVTDPALKKPDAAGRFRRADEPVHDYLGQKQQEQQTAATQLRSLRQYNHRQQALLMHALRHAGAEYSIESHKASHAIAYATARSDLLALEKAGLLTKVKRGKEMFFEPEGDLLQKLATIPKKPAESA